MGNPIERTDEVSLSPNFEDDNGGEKSQAAPEGEKSDVKGRTSFGTTSPGVDALHKAHDDIHREREARKLTPAEQSVERSKRQSGPGVSERPDEGGGQREIAEAAKRRAAEEGVTGPGGRPVQAMYMDEHGHGHFVGEDEQPEESAPERQEPDGPTPGGDEPTR